MKNILFIFLLIPLISIGQEKDIIELRNEINIMKENLDSHHKQFKVGVKISLVAIPITIIGSISTWPVMGIIGGVSYLFGTILILDSDKWFGKKYMNKKNKVKSKGYITEEKIQIFEGDKVQVITPFRTINGTFINQDKGRFSIKTTKGKKKVFIFKNIKSLKKVD